MKIYTDEEQKKIFAKNLNRQLELNTKTQIDLINDLGINKSTISTWCNGTKMPRMGKIQELADYFHCSKSDLLEDHTTYTLNDYDISDFVHEDNNYYYMDSETREMAQALKENKEMKLLFDAAKDVSADDLKFVHEMLLRMKKVEKGED